MEFLNFFLHIDEYLIRIIDQFGLWSYVILFVIIFAETGLVIIPFLPGDSLLFVVGTLAGSGYLNIWFVYFSLLIAAILGDTVNYWLGNKLGSAVFERENSRLFNKAHLEKTREFYEKHGAKTIILARFIPIIRTFAPFVAGVGKMHYDTFLSYNVFGGFIWVTGLTFAGYFLGGLPIVKNNFETAIYGLVALSLLPVAIEFIKHKFFDKEIRKSSKSTNYKEIKETFKEEHLG
jgi:membrane-associated protein